jgi:hypothetical protein
MIPAKINLRSLKTAYRPYLSVESSTMWVSNRTVLGENFSKLGENFSKSAGFRQVNHSKIRKIRTTLFNKNDPPI